MAKACVRGFSLLENLIALLILSMGILSFTKAQLHALAHCYNAMHYSIAIIQLNNAFEEANVYQLNPSQWYHDIAESLPQGRGELLAGQESKVFWSAGKEISSVCQNYARISVQL